MGGDFSEDRLRLLKIAEHRIAEDGVAITCAAAGLRAWLRPRGRKIYQTGWVMDRQRTEEQLIEERKDCRGRPDTQSQRNDRNDADGRRLQKLP